MEPTPPLTDEDKQANYEWTHLIAAWLLDMTDNDFAAAHKLLDKVQLKATQLPEQEFHPSLLVDTHEHIDDLVKSPNSRFYRKG